MNGKIVGYVLRRAALVAAIASSLFYGIVAYRTLHYEPQLLLTCFDIEPDWRAWICEKVLKHAALTPAQVQALNSEGGALYPVLLENPRKAEDMLSLFVSHGVDINAGDPRTKSWTALHVVALRHSAERVALLLRYGARTDVRDQDGNTPLDVARRALKRFPDDPNLPKNIRLLEAAEHGPRVTNRS